MGASGQLIEGCRRVYSVQEFKANSVDVYEVFLVAKVIILSKSYLNTFAVRKI